MHLFLFPGKGKHAHLLSIFNMNVFKNFSCTSHRLYDILAMECSNPHIHATKFNKKAL